MNRWIVCAACAIALTAGCRQKQPVRSNPFPDRADVEALVTPRPKQPPAALTDPTADTAHREALREWGDVVMDAGEIVCNFLHRSGMAVDCNPDKEKPRDGPKPP